MSRWSAYGPLDTRLVQDGDAKFIGIDMTRDRPLLQPGLLARAENKRLRIGAAATRLGNVQPEDFAAAFVAPFIGSNIYSNPLGDELTLVAEAGQTYVWALRYGASPFKVNLFAGQTLAGFTSVEFVQSFDKVMLLRWPPGTSKPLIWDGVAGHTFDLMPAPTAPLTATPALRNGEPFQSRILLYNAQATAAPWSYQFIETDILDYTGYDAVLGAFYINAGESDSIMRIWPYFQRSVVVFKRHTIHLAQDFAGDPTLASQRQISKRVGLCATKCVAEWGGDLAFLSEPVGIYRLIQPQDNLITIEALPVSDPIQPVINRINWSQAKAWACAQALGEYAYFAVPLDGVTGGNNAVLVLNLASGLWESAPDRWSDPTFLIHALHVTNFKGGRSVFGLDYVNQKIYALYQQEGFDTIHDDLQPITDVMETRGYICGDANSFKRFSRAIVTLRTSNPLIEVSAISDGMNEVKALTPNPLTKDRQKFYPHGHPDFNLAGGSDPTEPKRQDYSETGVLDPFAGEDYELIPVGPVSAIPPSLQPVPGPRQEAREALSVRVNARWLSLRIENLGSICDVLASGVEGRQSFMETKTAA